MPCYYPITGYRSRNLNENGKRPIVFDIKLGYKDMKVQVPCGQCIGCRLEYSRQWAIRCIHELQMHDRASFVTLTYKETPEDGSVNKRELQLFLKRLRKEVDVKIRFFACGEYGDKNSRPHYHLIIFGYDFPDKVIWKRTKLGHFLYRSKQLEKVWTLGYSLIGDVTFESCAYVARYIIKKQKGKDSPEKYEIVDPETGEIFKQEKEFCTMSRREGIGKEWFKKFRKDTDKDYITLRGQKMKLPKFYDTLLEGLETEEMEFEKRKAKRRAKAEKRKEDNTMERLAVKEKVKKEQLTFLHRELEIT